MKLHIRGIPNGNWKNQNWQEIEVVFRYERRKESMVVKWISCKLNANVLQTNLKILNCARPQTIEIHKINYISFNHFSQYNRAHDISPNEIAKNKNQFDLSSQELIGKKTKRNMQTNKKQQMIFFKIQ